MTKTNINWGRFFTWIEKKCAVWTQIIDKKNISQPKHDSIFLNRFPWRENRRFKAALVNYLKDTLYYISVCSYSVHPLLILFACVFIDKHFFFEFSKEQNKMRRFSAITQSVHKSTLAQTLKCKHKENTHTRTYFNVKKKKTIWCRIELRCQKFIKRFWKSILTLFDQITSTFTTHFSRLPLVFFPLNRIKVPEYQTMHRQ